MACLVAEATSNFCKQLLLLSRRESTAALGLGLFIVLRNFDPFALLWNAKGFQPLFLKLEISASRPELDNVLLVKRHLLGVLFVCRRQGSLTFVDLLLGSVDLSVRGFDRLVRLSHLLVSRLLCRIDLMFFLEQG